MLSQDLLEGCLVYLSIEPFDNCLKNSLEAEQLRSETTAMLAKFCL